MELLIICHITSKTGSPIIYYNNSVIWGETIRLRHNYVIAFTIYRNYKVKPSNNPAG